MTYKEKLLVEIGLLDKSGKLTDKGIYVALLIQMGTIMLPFVNLEELMRDEKK